MAGVQAGGGLPSGHWWKTASIVIIGVVFTIILHLIVCVAVHVPRVIEVFSINTEVRQPGDHQL